MSPSKTLWQGKRRRRPIAKLNPLGLVPGNIWIVTPVSQSVTSTRKRDLKAGSDDQKSATTDDNELSPQLQYNSPADCQFVLLST
mmetsp:Transcript_62882/g.124203  ORF Transcript_62882/g.124203 Transcript_62882/m.124203 type:complete len:85 (+) Transcript_62882:260-514(+)